MGGSTTDRPGRGLYLVLVQARAGLAEVAGLVKAHVVVVGGVYLQCCVHHRSDVATMECPGKQTRHGSTRWQRDCADSKLVVGGMPAFLEF